MPALDKRQVVPRAKKHLGQHFLRDQSVIASIVQVIAPQPDDHILEIGPGRGALTAPLIASGAALSAVEIDRQLAATLRHRWPTLRLIEADVLTLDWPAVLGNQSWRLCGNLPYNIASNLLTNLPMIAARFSDGLFMVQEEVALRITAEPHSRARGRLSVWMQYHFAVELLFQVPPSAFRPEPAVNSRMIRLRPSVSPSPLADQSLFSFLVKAAFSQKRKQITNALRSIAGLLPPSVSIQTLLLQAGIAPDCRAETLAVDDFVALANQAHALGMRLGEAHP